VGSGEWGPRTTQHSTIHPDEIGGQLVDLLAFAGAVDLGVAGQDLFDQAGAGADQADHEDRHFTVDAQRPRPLQELRREHGDQVVDQGAVFLRIKRPIGQAIDLPFELVGLAVASKSLVKTADPLPMSREGEIEQAGILNRLPARAEQLLHVLDVGLGQGIAAVAGQFPQGAIGQGRVRIQTQGVQAVGQRFFQMALLLEGVAEEEVLVDGARLETDGLAVMEDGIGDPSGSLVGGGEIAVKVGLVGQLGDGLADQVDGHFRLADLVGEDAQQVESVGLAWPLLEHLTVEGFGPLQIAGLMVLEGLVESGTHRVHEFSLPGPS
jgi:hypothetical protein